MKSGLYALASLDGAPLADGDADRLGLSVAAEQRPGIVFRAVDREEDGRAIHLGEHAGCVGALLGHLDEPDDLSDALGLSRGAPHAHLALAALARFGDEAPVRMLGEWSLLCWHAANRELTAMVSDACRDPMYFAADGRRVALSPEIGRLARLGWVDDAFDAQGLALQLSRHRLRRVMTNETAIVGVKRVMPGTREVFGPVRRSGQLCPQPQPPAWQGGFDDAVAAVEAALRRIMGQLLRRHGAAASLLSGGLDSSLLAWLEAEARGVDQRLFFLTSAAPDGGAFPDERAFSQIVAERLGAPVVLVRPSPSASPYSPAARMFAHSELPVASPRHYLYDALYDAAFAEGADVLFDGVYGEMSVTNKLPLALPSPSLRQRLRGARAWLSEERSRNSWPAGAFHARLSKDALAGLPKDWRGEWRAPLAIKRPPSPAAPWGFHASIRKNALTPSSSPDARFRHLMPFRDRRLLRLVASMPAAFLHQDGLDRALARAVLKDRLPDEISLRRSGGRFSPDYEFRLRTKAAEARARIGAYRASGAGVWLDLDWLDAALTRIGDGWPATAIELSQAQCTAIAAEFFVWWKDRMRD